MLIPTPSEIRFVTATPRGTFPFPPKMEGYMVIAYRGLEEGEEDTLLCWNLEQNKRVDRDQLIFKDSFDPAAFPKEIWALAEELATEKDKVKALDDMVKQLKAGNDPTIQSLTLSLDGSRTDNERLREELRQSRREISRMHDSLNEAFKENRELEAKVKKLTNDLLSTANERDNEVSSLAIEKAKDMLPNLKKERDFYRRQATELAAENRTLNEEVSSLNASGSLDKGVHVQYLRDIRKLERKLHKAKGREKRQAEHALNRFKENLDLSKQLATLQTQFDTVNLAFNQERKLSKELAQNLDSTLNRLDKLKAGKVEETSTPETGVKLPDKIVNLTVNIASLNVMELNNYT